MRIPFFKDLESAHTVLLAGAGGGFDIYTGLPLYFCLRKAGKTVHLANLTFTDLHLCSGQRPHPAVMRVTADTLGPVNYFPEAYLAQWISDRFEPATIFAIDRTGAKPIAEGYQWLVDELRPDTIILVDGGTDSLMRGDEADLGTPQEDIASLAAVHGVVNVARKYLVLLGFGIDAFHGVCHAHFLENVAALMTDGYLGAWALLPGMEEFCLYEQAFEFVKQRMPHHPSIVNSSIVAAVKGWFGDRHPTNRTRGSTLFLNPLMGLYWAFRLESVAKRNLYLDRIRNTRTYEELCLAIERFRCSIPKTRFWSDIPC